MEEYINLPLDNDTKQALKAGQKVYLSGIVYTARDAAHKKLVEAINNKEPLPFDLKDAAVYYTGPTPAGKNGLPGAAGPTTSSRMDPYTLQMLKAGVSTFIGKGERSPQTQKDLIDYGAIYFTAVGGAGALLSRSIRSMQLIAYPELGPEAVYLMEIENMPVYVGLDLRGNSIFKTF
ncbi:MAG: FumA C-terminus/TtdB family hydratase beta subunit [Candidatus Margulisiibacteriota bacterium]